jgi:hypothetical protein
MGKFVLAILLSVAASAQTMVEYGAAAAAGTAGGAAGKQVSNGITAIFGKVDQQTKDAAKSAPPKPAPSAAAAPPAAADPGPVPQPAAGAKPKAPKAAVKPAAKSETAIPPSPARTGARPVPNSVPDPPPPAVQRTAAAKPAPPPAPKPEPELAPVPPPPPPPREASAEDLKAIAVGTLREEVLKLGAPASRITMMDDGHLLEIYSYMNSDTALGVVRLSDGAVSRVELR